MGCIKRERERKSKSMSDIRDEGELAERDEPQAILGRPS